MASSFSRRFVGVTDETIARIATTGTGAADIATSRQMMTNALNSVIA